MIKPMIRNLGLVPQDWRWLWRNALLMDAFPDGLPVDLVGGQVGTIAGTPDRVESEVGPGMGFVASSSERITYPGKPVIGNGAFNYWDQALTLAVVCRLVSSATNDGGYLYLSTTVDTGIGINNDFSNLRLQTGASSHNSTYSRTAGDLIFFGASVPANGQYEGPTLVVRNLLTGVLTEDDLTSEQTISRGDGDGTFAVGWGGEQGYSDHDVFMACVLEENIPADALVKWSEDPFGPFRFGHGMLPHSVAGSRSRIFGPWG